jgi:hypothetical protein
MYICQDKCYRLVPPKDHRYAQFEDYIEGGVFCGICSVVMEYGGPAYVEIQKKYHETGNWVCPCCSARPRSYFDLQKKKREHFLKMLQQSEVFDTIVDEFFRVRKQVKEEEEKFRALVQSLKTIVAPPQRHLTKEEKLAMIAKESIKLDTFIETNSRVKRAVEISMFPQ